jgi:hypothetical protein
MQTSRKKVAKRVAKSVKAVPTVRLPSISKGKRPEFYEDPAIDQLFAIVTALTAEVSVAFDRIDTLERLLIRKRTLSLKQIESFLPDATAEQERTTRRDELLRRVFAVIEIYAASKR